MDDPKNLYSIRARSVEYEHSLEARDSKHPQSDKSRVLEARIPSHVGLGGEERKCFVGCEEKVVTNFGACVSSKIISLVVKILIGLGANNVAGTQRVPVFFRRSSNERCLASQ